MRLSKPTRHSCGYVDANWKVQSEQPFSNPLPFDTRESGLVFGSATLAMAQDAVAVARRAASPWAAMPSTKRAELLSRAAALIEENQGALVDIMAREAGKPLLEARAEVAAAAGFLKNFAGWAAWGSQGQVKRNGSLRVIQEKYPRGVAAIITPWNYPLSNPCQKIGAALIGGNAVIWRPSTATPEMAFALTEIFHQAAFPAGVFQMLVESGDAVSRALVAHEGIDAISFTGSTRVGLQVAASAALRGAAVQCEMGGKNAVVVMPDADLDLAAQRIAYGAFGFGGQKCTAVSRLLIHRDVFAPLLERLQAAAETFLPGVPHTSDACLAPLISRTQRDTLVRLLREAQARGVQLVHGGRAVESAQYVHGNYLYPAIALVQDSDEPLWREECFGPILAVMGFDTLDEAVALVNGSRYGLGAALFTNDAACIARFSDAVQAGVIKINDVPPGLFPHVSAGGWKASGCGQNELSEDGVDFFMHKKSVYLT